MRATVVFYLLVILLICITSTMASDSTVFSTSTNCFRQYLNINSITTPVVSWPNPIKENVSKEVIIVIPGNPGVTKLYIKSLSQMYEAAQLPVWIVGNAGHETPTAEEIAEHNLAINTSDAKYNLDDQLQHKLQFILQFTEATSKIHLVGHSIGAWIVLELLKNDVINSRVASANLLYPTVQRMAIAPNGVAINRLRQVDFILNPLTWMFYKVPKILSYNIAAYFLTLENQSPVPELVYSFVNWINPRVVENVFFMAYDEMDNVNELDIDTLMANKDKINILYGSKDGWAPKEWFLDLKTKIPSMRMQELPYDHSFVMYETNVGETVADLITKIKLQ